MQTLFFDWPGLPVVCERRRGGSMLALLVLAKHRGRMATHETEWEVALEGTALGPKTLSSSRILQISIVAVALLLYIITLHNS